MADYFNTLKLLLKTFQYYNSEESVRKSFSEIKEKASHLALSKLSCKVEKNKIIKKCFLVKEYHKMFSLFVKRQ